MNMQLLVNLTSKAWSLKILAQLHAGVSGRQAPLITATGASRSSFAASLEHLFQLGLLERNPGHGHPLRPEFRLTDKGKAVAAMRAGSRRSFRTRMPFRYCDAAGRCYPAVTGAPSRFSAIKSDLGPVTDRALSKSLGVLEEQEWLRRDIDLSQRTPFPIYHAVNAGLKINQAIAAGAR